MAFLVDTSVLVRLANQADSSYAVADSAVLKLNQRGEALYVTPQNFVEFRGVATRPVSANGLGLAVAEAEAKAAVFETTFGLLPETPDIFPTWKALVAAATVVGKQVHDARLVAVCHTYGIANLLTFNTGHFQGLSGFGPGLLAIHPKDA